MAEGISLMNNSHSQRLLNVFVHREHLGLELTPRRHSAQQKVNTTVVRVVRPGNGSRVAKHTLRSKYSGGMADRSGNSSGQSLTGGSGIWAW